MPEAHADDDRPAAEQPAARAQDEPRTAAPDDAATPADAAATPDRAAGDDDARGDAPVPSEEELARIATPATVRRAPRYGAFLRAGALLGGLLGLVLALLLAPDGAGAGSDVGVLPFLDGRSTVVALALVTGVVLGLLVGALAALVADRRSTRRRR